MSIKMIIPRPYISACKLTTIRFNSIEKSSLIFVNSEKFFIIPDFYRGDYTGCLLFNCDTDKERELIHIEFENFIKRIKELCADEHKY